MLTSMTSSEEDEEKARGKNEDVRRKGLLLSGRTFRAEHWHGSRSLKYKPHNLSAGPLKHISLAHLEWAWDFHSQAAHGRPLMSEDDEQAAGTT